MIIQNLSLLSTYIEVYAWRKRRQRRKSMIRLCKYWEHFHFWVSDSSDVSLESCQFCNLQFSCFLTHCLFSFILWLFWLGSEFDYLFLLIWLFLLVLLMFDLCHFILFCLYCTWSFKTIHVAIKCLSMQIYIVCIRVSQRVVHVGTARVFWVD